MSRVLFIFLLSFLTGCVTLEVPKYLEEEFQYKKKFNSNFNETFVATVKALESLGWKVAETESPPISNVDMADKKNREHNALIFTEIKQRSLFVFSTYLTLNAYVKSIDKNNSEVEIRYLSTTIFPPLFKEWQVNKNDGLVRKIYKKIGEYLEKKLSQIRQ
ncbi:MAG: hypothetical protein ISS47_09590 [Candidatus Omnitrophica bacterium]|nr:hypothetical protein [Candidatus Omnitrophota bacterium]